MVLKGEVTTALRIQTPAEKFFNFLLKQLHDVQKTTERVQETKDLQGDRNAVGSVRSWTYTLDGKVKICKDRIEAIGEENKSITYKLFDGEVSKRLKILRLILQVIDKEDAGAVAKWTYAYEKFNEEVPSPAVYLDFITTVTKDVDAHLIVA